MIGNSVFIHMQVFTIRDIENLTGIKAHTLRIWEQRYDLFTPRRKESQHRIYDNEDLKQLLRISFLYHSGMKVSKIAALSQGQITELVNQATVGNMNYRVFINQLIEAALDFDENRFIGILNQVTEKIGFENCVVDLCYPFLVKIGLLWSTNNVIPAQEHFTSYIIQNKIIVETEKLEVGNTLPSIVLMSPKGEFHELPLLFINYLLKKAGWATVYLGSNIQTMEAAEVVNRVGMHYLYIHTLTNFTGLDIDDYFESVCKSFSDKKIVASGEAIQKVQRSFVNLILLRTKEQIYDFIRKAK
jgi:MerR family transcriptional regulator, light-induced transcriptional regulator